MPTRNVVITDRQAKLIDELVASGVYQNASEVLRDAIRLIEEREKAKAARLEALRAAVVVGEEALERGQYKDFTDSRSLKAHLRKVADKAINGRKVS